MDSLDRIEKTIDLRAGIERVWQAITDYKEFSQWFGVALDQPFEPGRSITGSFEMAFDEDAIIRHQKSLGVHPSGIRTLEPNTVFCTVERMDAPHAFSFRWIPYGIDADCDPAAEPTTLVEFTLAPTADGTRLTIVESGFERVPEHRRLRAFRMNQGGWAAQADNIARHVEQR
ncbi:SRPBCC family protein [Massilia varians]